MSPPEELGDRELEARANMSRARLFDAIEVLDHRRHDALDVHQRIETVRSRVRQHGASVLALFGVAALTGLAGIGYLVHRVATRDSRRMQERAEMLDRLWTHPERVARKHDPGPSLLPRIAKTVLLAVVTRAVRSRL